MKTIDINALETVTGGTAASYRRLATTLRDGVAGDIVAGVNLVKGGAILKAGTDFSMKKGQTLDLRNTPYFGRAH